jgi:multiple sugar transport system permease protein
MTMTSTETRQKSWWRSNQQWLTPWLFLTPGMILFAVYVVWPIYSSFQLSFYDWDGLRAPDGSDNRTWVGFGNYTELFGDRAFLTSFFFPFVISQVVVGLMFTWFYAPNFGLVYKLTEALTGTGFAILASPTWATYGIIAAGLWPQIAYCMILYLTGLNNVAADQIEAARLDNAKGLKMLWYVILPQLRPATFIAVVVTVIGALRSFDLVSIMTTGGPFGSTRVLSYYMYEKALSEYGYRMGYGAAIAVILFMIMMVFISAFIWKMIRDERGNR